MEAGNKDRKGQRENDQLIFFFFLIDSDCKLSVSQHIFQFVEVPPLMFVQLTSPQVFVFLICFETTHIRQGRSVLLKPGTASHYVPSKERTLPLCSSPGSANAAALVKSAQPSQQVEAPSPTAAVHRLDLQFSHTVLNLPCSSLLSLLFFFFNAESSNPLAQLAPRYQIPTEEFWARSFTEQTGLPPSLNISPSLSPSLSIAGNPPLSSAAGAIFLNCVYLLAPWCESVSHQLHINLVSSLWTFSSLP